MLAEKKHTAMAEKRTGMTLASIYDRTPLQAEFRLFDSSVSNNNQVICPLAFCPGAKKLFAMTAEAICSPACTAHYFGTNGKYLFSPSCTFATSSPPLFPPRCACAVPLLDHVRSEIFLAHWQHSKCKPKNH